MKKQVNYKVIGEEWKEAKDKAFNKLVKKVKVDGFREGKVPRNVFEKKYGTGDIISEAMEDLVRFQRTVSAGAVDIEGGKQNNHVGSVVAREIVLMPADRFIARVADFGQRAAAPRTGELAQNGLRGGGNFLLRIDIGGNLVNDDVFHIAAGAEHEQRQNQSKQRLQKNHLANQFYLTYEIIQKFSKKAGLRAYFAFNTCARVRHQV